MPTSICKLKRQVQCHSSKIFLVILGGMGWAVLMETGCSMTQVSGKSRRAFQAAWDVLQRRQWDINLSPTSEKTNLFIRKDMDYSQELKLVLLVPARYTRVEESRQVKKEGLRVLLTECSSASVKKIRKAKKAVAKAVLVSPNFVPGNGV